MLLRNRPSPRSLSLPRVTTLRRPHLPGRHTSIHSDQETCSISTPRLLVTWSELPPWRRKTNANLYSQIANRPLATAVDDVIRQDDVPFDPLHSRNSNSNTYKQPNATLPLYHLRSFDPAAPLQVKVVDEVIPRLRLSSAGVPGGCEEMISVFDACLDVNKLERAAIVLERCRLQEGFSYHDLINLHNQYLRAGIDRALDQPESQWAQSLHQWFEVQIRGREIPHTSETIACMLKVSLLSAQGPRLARLVTRYLDMLPEEDSIWSVLDAGILNQQDFGTITSIYQPTSNLALDGWDSLSAETQINEDSAVETSPSEAKIKSTVVPDVLPVSQKGLGLKSLRGVLSFFDQIDGKDLSCLTPDERREIQARLEKDCVEAAVVRWREENQLLAKMGRTTSLSKHALNSQLYDWQCTLERKLQEEFDLIDISEGLEKKTVEDLDRCLYGPFFRQSNPTRLAAVTIMGVLNSLAQHGADKGVALSVMINQLAKIVEDDIKFQARQRQAALRKAQRRDSRLQRSPKLNKPVESGGVQAGRASTSTSTDPNIVDGPIHDNRTWPVLIKTKVGAHLLSALLASAKVEVVREHPVTKALVSQVQPALTHTTVHRKGKKVGLVKPNKVLVDLMKREPRGDYLARHLPMLVEPTPWTKFDRGGFLQFPSQLVRIKNGERDQRIYAEAAFERGDLDQVSKALDVLGRTAWQINKPVFNVLLEAWNTGEKIANIPPLTPDIPLPEEPEASDDPMVRREWLRRLKTVENEKSGLHSERCFMNFQLDIARAFRDQTFYFPHNMDFRGRAYPIPAYLNHMGADHVRGLLRFAAGKELGASGLRWLKVQLANVFGYDKASLEERESFAADHIKDIYDSATNPLTGDRWWLKAEDPWQCLAACFELRAALDSPDPTKYVSHLPVHQDGTCNGLQHYAALGGDLWGAQQVNLLPGDRPADVYTAVADLVKSGIADDLKTGNFLAKAVDGKITRKVVKQTVMTNVYGVTFVGARTQVTKQIDAAYPSIETETGVSSPVLAAYVATKIFKALSTMFRGAHDIQYWLSECAGRVCRGLTPEQLDRIAAGTVASGKTKKKPTAKSSTEDILSQFRSTIVWTTPLRMPIVQPYRKTGQRVIATSLQALTLLVPERSDPVNARKQLQAFPPNFIHSLDASHMLLSALECDELGLSFAAVHDSFWTHAADVDVMNRVLRDAFIRIHSEDVIGRLASEFLARYKGSIYLAKIAKTTELEQAISKFRTKRKDNMHKELLEERERQRLLNSSDPEEVQKGREMVTPASIYEQFSSKQPLSSSEEIEEVGLGNIGSSKQYFDELRASTAISKIRAGEGGLNIERIQEQIDMGHFESTFVKHNNPDAQPKAKPQYINVWLPLTFPDIPPKGDFDVSQLKSSKYFFS